MKRFHLHVSVLDLDESVRFYSKLFAAQPAVWQMDYAKWMLEDPRINFQTLGSIPVYGEDTPVFNHGSSTVPTDQAEGKACCVP